MTLNLSIDKFIKNKSKNLHVKKTQNWWEKLSFFYETKKHTHYSVFSGLSFTESCQDFASIVYILIVGSAK